MYAGLLQVWYYSDCLLLGTESPCSFRHSASPYYCVWKIGDSVHVHLTKCWHDKIKKYDSCWWKGRSSGMWHRVIRCVVPDVWKECCALALGSNSTLLQLLDTHNEGTTLTKNWTPNSKVSHPRRIWMSSMCVMYSQIWNAYKILGEKTQRGMWKH